MWLTGDDFSNNSQDFKGNSQAYKRPVPPRVSRTRTASGSQPKVPLTAKKLPESFKPSEGIELGWEDCTEEFGSVHRLMDALNFGKKELPVSTQRAHLYRNFSAILYNKHTESCLCCCSLLVCCCQCIMAVRSMLVYFVLSLFHFSPPPPAPRAPFPLDHHFDE